MTSETRKPTATTTAKTAKTTSTTTSTTTATTTPTDELLRAMDTREVPVPRIDDVHTLEIPIVVLPVEGAPARGAKR